MDVMAWLGTSEPPRLYRSAPVKPGRFTRRIWVTAGLPQSQRIAKNTRTFKQSGCILGTATAQPGTVSAMLPDRLRLGTCKGSTETLATTQYSNEK